MDLPHTLNKNRVLRKLKFDLLYTKYNKHRRLQVFAKKGTACIRCGVKGVYLLASVDRGGGHHVDLFTADYTLMTIDHIVPRSKGGASSLANYQPMCQHCNSQKGNTLEQTQPDL